jgi:hypothetical protein
VSVASVGTGHPFDPTGIEKPGTNLGECRSNAVD